MFKKDRILQHISALKLILNVTKLKKQLQEKKTVLTEYVI